MSQNTGMPVNQNLIFDAVMFKGANSNIVREDRFQNGNAIYSMTPGQRLMDIPAIPAGALSGLNAITIHWESSSNTDFDIRLEIIEDSRLVGDISFKYEDPAIYKGTIIFQLFKPTNSYRFRITSLTSNDIYLDFFQITPMTTGGMISATRRVNNGKEMIEIIDRGTVNVTGNGSGSTFTSYFYYNTIFSEVPSVFFTSPNWKLHPTLDSKSEKGAQVALTHTDNTSWTGTFAVDWVAIGSVKTPFAPAVPI